ncbi:hypothetical protein GCM10027275_35360 [Rhabdobacter roseus]|uniref:Uncharacterized protein n=1 Tax=Rhabdobacter roseus TaxID=1655419 RepID=A0A840TUK0_9BACT|nr:caspase family protein [Rhabdobacter roseus]MBB5285242.1 hypothetical protein [Rhabdobacter roseus]
MRSVLVILCVAFFGLTAQAQTLHLMLVSEVEKQPLGMVSLKDEERIVQFFKTVEWGLGYKLEISYLNRRDFTAAAIKQTIAALRTTPEDILVFYYSGPGYYIPKNQSYFPFLKVKDYRKNPLSLDDVGTLLLAKGTRLSIALVDGRDSRLPPPLSPITPPPPSVQVDLRKVVLQKLMLEPTGLLKIASARPPQAVYAQRDYSGSLFTYKFNQEVNFLLKTNYVGIDAISWAYLLTQVRNSVSSMAQNAGVRQDAVWQFMAYKPNTRFKTYDFPSYRHALQPWELEKKLLELKADAERESQQNKAAELSQGFQENATVRVVRRFSATRREESTEYGLAQYLETLRQHSGRRVVIKVDVASLKRTPDLSKITFVKITETWTE